MKNEEIKQRDEKIKGPEEQVRANRQPEEATGSDKKETMEERAKRENWTDVAESHLGIDE